MPQSIDALAEALQQFEGGVVIISHDAQLLSRVCDETSEVRTAAYSAPACKPLATHFNPTPELCTPSICCPDSAGA